MELVHRLKEPDAINKMVFWVFFFFFFVFCFWTSNQNHPRNCMYPRRVWNHALSLFIHKHLYFRCTIYILQPCSYRDHGLCMETLFSKQRNNKNRKLHKKIIKNKNQWWAHETCFLLLFWKCWSAHQLHFPPSLSLIHLPQHDGLFFFPIQLPCVLETSCDLLSVSQEVSNHFFPNENRTPD